MEWNACYRESVLNYSYLKGGLKEAIEVWESHSVKIQQCKAGVQASNISELTRESLYQTRDG